MAYQFPRQHNGRTGPQARWGNQQNHNGRTGPQARWGHQQNQQAWSQPPPVDFLHGEIQRLNHLLEMEKGRWFEENQKVVELEGQLEETKLEVKRQKNLKEMFINKGKETKKELERLQKVSDPEILNSAAIAEIVHNDMKYKKKKMLQKDFDELKVAHILVQQSLTSQIQAEKDKNIALQEELYKLKTSYQELPSKSKDAAAEMQHVGIQTEDEQRTSENEQLLENFIAEKEDLFQKMSQEIASLRERDTSLLRQLDQLQVSYQELNCRYEKDVSALKQQAEAYQQELNCHKNASSERARQDLQLINDLGAEKYDLYQKMSQEVTLLQEKEKNSQSELQQLRESYHEMTCMYEKDVSLLKQQVEKYQKEVDHEKKANSERAKNDLQQINQLRAERLHLYQEMSQEIQILKQKELVNHLSGETEQSEKENSALKQQVEKLQLQIIQEKKSHLEASKKDLTLLNKLRAEQDHLKENASKEITFLQEKEKRLQGEMDKIQVLHQELNSRYETDVSALKQQVETLKQEKNIQKEPQQEVTVPACTDLDNCSEENLSETGDLTEESTKVINKDVKEITDEPVMQSETNNPDTKPMAGAGKETKSKRSAWKRLRHSLGLRKSKK
ncbi:myosin-1B-like [Cyprinodon tularosa]|uniref:myosin-1B-like n=1 Tax=Cyprinodon tularosa TaxID=77115 RepID=UPI0018E20C00|nr:myosin-1B-like [Cyprinodon tularosa]